MIAYIETVEDRTEYRIWIYDMTNLVELKYRIGGTDRAAPSHLTRRMCGAIDLLLGDRVIILWRDAEDLEQFICSTKKYLRLRIKRHSVVLPSVALELLPASGRITIADLCAACDSAGIDWHVPQKYHSYIGRE